MIRLLPVGIVVLLMVSALFYLRFFHSDNSPAALINNYQPVSDSPQQLVSPSGNFNERVRDLEEAVALLSQKIGNTTTATPTPGGSVTSWGGVPEAKIKSLEDSVINLQKQIDSLKTTSAGKSAVYIPLAVVSSTTDLNWNSAEGQQVSLDPADFPGYSSMMLEGTGKMAQLNNGTGYIRLFNESDNSAVSSSEASFTSDKYNLSTSAGFKLASGRKTYRLQFRSSSGMEFYLQSARIKVSF